MIERYIVEQLREEFRPGTRVVLLYMDDCQAPPKGTKGTVRCVDDIGNVHINWDNGSSLGAVYGVDSIKVISEGDE